MLRLDRSLLSLLYPEPLTIETADFRRLPLLDRGLELVRYPLKPAERLAERLADSLFSSENFDFVQSNETNTPGRFEKFDVNILSFSKLYWSTLILEPLIVKSAYKVTAISCATFRTHVAVDCHERGHDICIGLIQLPDC